MVTFNQVTDIDFLVKNGFVSEDWQSDFPNASSPFYSLPSFLVRAGNPKGIKDWGDLVRADVKVIFPIRKPRAMRATPIWPRRHTPGRRSPTTKPR